MCCEIVTRLLRPLLHQDRQGVDRRVNDLRIGVAFIEHGYEIIPTPYEPSVQPGDVLEEAQRVLYVGGLHQLAGSLANRDVSGSGAATEGADNVGGEADHLG